MFKVVQVQAENYIFNSFEIWALQKPNCLLLFRVLIESTLF